MGLNDEAFSKEKVSKLLFKFSVPAIVSLLVAELYNMVDTIFVGREIGANAIGALVVVFPIQRIIAAVGMLLAIGTSTSVARSNGEKDYDNLRLYIRNALSLAMVLTFLLIISIFIFKEKLLVFLGASSVVLPYANDYLSIILMGSIFQCFTVVIGYILMSLGNRRVLLTSNFIGATTNIIVDYILVVSFNLGVKGAAIATVASQILAFTYMLYNFVKANKVLKIKIGFNINRKIAKSIIMIGFAAFIIEAEDGLALAVLNNLLLNNVGDIGVIVSGVISKVFMFMFITIIGISSAMQPIAAYNSGAGEYTRLRKVIRESIIVAFITSIILWAGALIFAKQIISVFVKDKHIIAESVKAFRIMISVFPIISLYYVSIYYFQAIGKAKTSFLLSIYRQLLLFIPLSVLFVGVLKLGAIGAWISYPISDIISTITSYFLIRRERVRINKKVEEKKKKVTTKKVCQMPVYEG
ncbi:MATE family efflux transporter [Proteiniborus sp. MB09-C3]|uniref:MATE family efflux transporter n=1 Tax=Proteiniborus sp. MB09-C3 TaxID=3050072 RepID=UPI0025521158|nr:MATE family efflux transporter [Proteiniborus sp. MB09-C3]WIV11921.1 MATE family efflux transporter [Proteiniborus sp. MB09-C3]